jgi:predicted nuclease with TOPRIM domain
MSYTHEEQTINHALRLISSMDMGNHDHAMLAQFMIRLLGKIDQQEQQLQRLQNENCYLQQLLDSQEKEVENLRSYTDSPIKSPRIPQTPRTTQSKSIECYQLQTTKILTIGKSYVTV